MNKEQLIREMIQIELLYRTRQQMKLLNESVSYKAGDYASYFRNNYGFDPKQVTTDLKVPDDKFTTLKNNATQYSWSTNTIDNSFRSVNDVSDEPKNTLLLLDALFHYTFLDKKTKAIILRRNMTSVYYNTCDEMSEQLLKLENKREDLLAFYNAYHNNYSKDKKEFFFLWCDPSPIGKGATERYPDKNTYSTYFDVAVGSTQMKAVDKSFQDSVTAGTQDEDYPIFSVDWLKKQIQKFENQINAQKQTQTQNKVKKVVAVQAPVQTIFDEQFYLEFFKGDDDKKKQLLTDDGIKNFCNEISTGTTNKVQKGFENFRVAKNISTSQMNSIMKKIYAVVSDNWDTNKEKYTNNQHKIGTYVKSFINFGWSKYTVNNIHELLDYLNKPETLQRFNDNNTFEYDMYRDSTKQTDDSTGYNTGKGELLFILYLKDAKTGGTTDRDILGSDENNPIQYEIKQGSTKSSECDFQIKIAANTKLNSNYSKVMNSVNNFMKGFSESVRTMSNILKLNSKYSTQWIINNLLDTANQKDNLHSRSQSADFKDLTYNFMNSLITNKDGLNRLKNLKGRDKFQIGNVFEKLRKNVSGQDISYGTDPDKQSNLTIIDYISQHKWNKDSKSSDALKNKWVTLNPHPIQRNIKIAVCDLKEDNKNNRPNDAICSVYELLERINQLSELDNPVLNSLNGEIEFKLSSASLRDCLQVYFLKIIEEYKAALDFYKNEITSIKKEVENNPKGIIDIYKQRKEDASPEFKSYLEADKSTHNNDFSSLLNYKLFFELSHAFNFEEEAVIDIKRYDQDHKLTGEKKLINTIGDEFTIVEPAGVDGTENTIDDFFDDKNDDKEVTIKLTNNMNHDKFKKIMDSKSIFTFLNNNFDSKSIINRNKSDSSASQNKNIQAANNKNLLFLLDQLIDQIIDIHAQCFDEYALGKSNDKVENKLNKGGLIYIAELRSDEAKSFAINDVMTKHNITNTGNQLADKIKAIKSANKKEGTYVKDYAQYDDARKQTLVTGFNLLFDSTKKSIGNIFKQKKEIFKSFDALKNGISDILDDFKKENSNNYIPFIKEIDSDDIKWLEFNPLKEFGLDNVTQQKTNKSILLVELLRFKQDLEKQLVQINTKLLDIATETKELSKVLNGLTTANDINVNDMGKFAKPAK